MQTRDDIATATRETFALYIDHGYLPGDFLTAVLQNDLRAAVAAADPINQTLLPTYVAWLISYAPYDCWGSPEQVEAWAAARRAERTSHHQEVR